MSPDARHAENLIGYALRLLEDVKPDRVLTGTAIYPCLDGVVVAAAKQRGVPAVSVIGPCADWRDALGTNMEHAADVMCVYDMQTAKSLAVYLGRGRIQVTGSPDTDSIGEKKARRAQITREVRAHFLIPDGKRLVTFLSSPIEEDNLVKSFGYGESDSLRALLKGMGSGSFPDVQVLVKMHPTRGSIEALRRVSDGCGVSALFDRGYDTIDVVLASDAVAGARGGALVKAAYAGVRMLCVEPYRPGLRPATSEPTVEAGIHLVSNTPYATGTALARMLNNPSPVTHEELQAKLGVPEIGKATERVAGIVLR